MILSKLHKFVFIKGKKVASASVEMALARLCGPEDIITPLTPIDERARLACGARDYSYDPEGERAYLSSIASPDAKRGVLRTHVKPRDHNHMSIWAVGDTFGSLDDYEILFVERNPYAKVISWANMAGGGYEAYNSGKVVQSSRADIQRRVDGAIRTGAISDARNIDRYRRRGATSPGGRYETLESRLKAWASDKGEIGLPHAKPG